MRVRGGDIAVSQLRTRAMAGRGGRHGMRCVRGRQGERRDSCGIGSRVHHVRSRPAQQRGRGTVHSLCRRALAERDGRYGMRRVCGT